MAKKPNNCKKHAADLLESIGFLVGNVEHYNAHSRRTEDLWGILDLIAVRPTCNLGLQVTDETHVAAHVDKLLLSDEFDRLLLSGWAIEIWGINRQKQVQLARSFTIHGREVFIADQSRILETYRDGKKGS